MHPEAYRKFSKTRDQPIEVWEKMLAESSGKEAAHMRIAIHARKSTEHLRKPDGRQEA